MENLEQIIELAMSEVDRIPPEKHKNLLGNKQKYIKAIADKVRETYGKSDGM